MPRLRNRTPYLLCLPLLAFLAFFFLLPVGQMMLLGLTPEKPAATSRRSRASTTCSADPYYQTLTVRTLRISLLHDVAQPDHGAIRSRS